jgi:hypothetical protein
MESDPDLPRCSGAPSKARIPGLSFVGRGSRRRGLNHAPTREADDDLSPVAESALKLESAVMEVGQAFGDREAKARTAFGCLLRKRTLAEAPKHVRDFIFGDAGARVLDAQELST